MTFGEHSSTPLFYIVLKGEVAIFTDTHNLRLLAPELSEHTYVAGPWLGEIQIPKHRKLQLCGATGGFAKPADFPDFLINLPNASAHPELSRIDITVPFPKTILPGAVMDAGNDEITIIHDDGTTEPLPQKLKDTCLAAILVYEWDGQHAPFLFDPESNRQWSSGGSLASYRSLNVCASGETKESEEDSAHSKQAFEAAAAVLGVRACINFSGGSATTFFDPPPGLSYYEINASHFELLQLRQELGQFFEGGPLQFQTPIMPRSASSGNCGPVGG